MNLYLAKVFFLQLGSIFLLWLVLRSPTRRMAHATILLAVLYLTAPIAILAKGPQSAVYASDLIAPFLFASACFSRRVRAALGSPEAIALLILLLVIPLTIGIIGASTTSPGIGLGARDPKGDVLWLFRNATMLLLFAIGRAFAFSHDEMRDFLMRNIYFGLVLGAWGIAHYFGPYNLAVFERFEFRGWDSEGYEQVRQGLGFMGIYRASVGQWFAMLVILGFGIYRFVSPRNRFFIMLSCIVGVSLVALSYSRAGLAGLCFGMALVAFVSGVGKRTYVVLGITVFSALGIILQSDTLTDRMMSIISGTEHAHDRASAWERALNFFLSNPMALAFGVGPTNRQAVFDAIGAYGAHNEYLDVVFRLGLFGFVVLLMAISALTLRIWRKRRRTDPKLRSFLNVSIVVIAMNCVIAITQEHLIRDYASYTMGAFQYFLYGVLMGSFSSPVVRVGHDPSSTRSLRRETGKNWGDLG